MLLFKEVQLFEGAVEVGAVGRGVVTWIGILQVGPFVGEVPGECVSFRFAFEKGA